MAKNARQESIPYGPEPSQFFELWLPDEPPRGAVLLIHGGLWLSVYDLGHLDPVCADLTASGLAVANLEYRRVGNPGGGWPGTFEDIRNGFDAARVKLPELPWQVMGHSAGGHLALLLGTVSDAMEGIVALAPVSCLTWAGQPELCRNSIVRFLGGLPGEIPAIYHAACPSEHPSPVPRLLVHGNDDHLVPVGMSRHFLSRRNMDAGPVRLLEIAGCDHFQLIDPTSKAWKAIKTLA